MAKRLTWFILLGLIAGVVVGLLLHATIGDATPDATAELKKVAGWFSIVSTVFLRMIKMIIAPLVFATLVAGIAHMGDTGALGRVGLKALGWFVGASLVSLTLGLIMFHLSAALGDWAGLTPHLTPPAISATSGLDKAGFDVAKMIIHIFPASIIEAMSTNEILPIVVFSVFFGVAITAVGDAARPIVAGVEALATVMLRVTDYVMRFAPIAVFAAIAAALIEHGPDLISKLGYFMVSVYAGLVALWLTLAAAAVLVLGRRALRLFGYIRDPALLAFSTASSEAALPRTLEALERFGVPPKIASFVLPLGYSFNLDGSMMYMTFASLFIARAYGIDLSLGTQVAMLLTLMVTSKGIAGVPRASLVVIAATLTQFGIPEAGLLLIIGIDQFLDMGRSATNVLGNAVAASVVARWEGDLAAPLPVAIDTPLAPTHGLSGAH